MSACVPGCEVTVGRRTRVIFGLLVQHSETISMLFCGLLAEGDVNKTIQEWKWAFSSKYVVINNLWGFWACVSWQPSYDHTCKPSEGKRVCSVLFNRFLYPIHVWFIIIYWFGFWHSVFWTNISNCGDFTGEWNIFLMWHQQSQTHQ